MSNKSDRIHAVETVRASIAASIRLREGLLHGESIGEAMIDAIEGGALVSESVEASGEDAATCRMSMHELLEGYEHARHKMRIAFMLPSIEEGMSIGAIGRTLGVSRQLAARLVHEAREEAEAHALPESAGDGVSNGVAQAH